MTKKINSEVFDAANFLDNEEVIAEYINIALESDDPNDLLRALDTVARAKGMSKIAKETGLNRESLYKSLKEGKRPYFDTLQKVLGSLGIKFKVVPSVS
ncbi:MAG TPA: putative addiction module antidote protein [Succinivibrionaceae bacterium]|nr:putative addiction module antidote protein [Succinivibrionaceae bacterium]